MCHTDQKNSFIRAHAIYNDNIYTIKTVQELTDFILMLPDKVWILTYNIKSFGGDIIHALLNHFARLVGIGEDTTVLTLFDYDINQYEFIDAGSFFAAPLEKMSKLLNLPNYDSQDTRAAVISLMCVWDYFSKAIIEQYFFTYPSKYPGATGVKMLRSYIGNYSISKRGKPLTRFLRSSIRAPALHWKPGIYPEAYHYDLNAAYVHAMRVLNFPTNLLTFSGKKPPSEFWIASVIIDYETDRKFSPLSVQIKDDNNVNPTSVKNARVTLTYIDALVLSTVGTLTITEWVEGVFWYPDQQEPLFQKWADKIQEVSKISPFHKQALKIVSRSLHSKFSQNPNYQLVELIESNYETAVRLARTGKVLDLIPLDNGKLAVKKKTNKRGQFNLVLRPDFDALIMAVTRLQIYSAIDENTVYVHTDGFISTQARLDISIGPDFGQWKLDNEGQAYIAGLGMYVLGSDFASTGINAHAMQLKTAIQNAARGIDKTISTQEKTGLLSFNPETRTIDFTIRSIPYPKARIIGNVAYISRSPEQAHERAVVRRSLTRKL